MAGRLTTTFLAAPLALGACIDYDPRALPTWPPPHDRAEDGTVVQTDAIVQVTAPRVDVLWMIDNSGSMGPFQESLTDNFPSFMTWLDGSGLDWHVGVTSSDLDGSYDGAQGRLAEVAGVKYLDPDVANPLQMFTALASLGTNGSSNEQGTGAVFLALEVRRDTDNAGFWRDDAAIHSIVVSDEADFSQAPSRDEFAGWYDGLKPSPDQRTFSAIVDPTDGGRYLGLAADLGGVTANILDDEGWPDILERLGVQAAGLKREYFLSQLPVEATIEVTVTTVDDTVLPPFEPSSADPANGGYTYDAFRNSVTFDVFVPEALSTVRISYAVLASAQAVEDIVEP